MPITPETLVRHELIGLPVRIPDAPNPDLVGIEGTVVMETTGTLSVAGDDRTRQVPKDGTTFEFRLPARSTASPGQAAGATTAVAAGEAEDTYVTVEGSRLVARPARRTERRGDSKWR